MRTFLSGLFARLGPPGDGEPSDDQLLAAFVASREEAAFQQIVRRHGAMVHGVCRRVLRNEADADDAFQAVFLVFIRKAGSVRPGNLLGNWLYGVAVNVARKGRELSARRRAHELAAPQVNARHESAGNSDLSEVIDQELNRLPASYRAAVVACDLEGRTRREAAAQLGWSEGTVASRLARARDILADRLTRRGVVLPATGLVSVLGVTVTGIAAVPRALFVGHSDWIDTLARETVKAMTANTVKKTALTLLAIAGLAGAGAGVVACGGYGSRPTPPPVSAAKPPPDRSVETITGENIVAGWSKPGAWNGDGSAKPGGENGGESKPARFLLRNPEADITIITDRDETFVEFFRRQRVMVASLSPKDFATVYSLKKLSEPIFVGSASQNQDGVLGAAYGAYVRVAPMEFDVSMALPPTNAGELYLVFQADPALKDAWHVVGYTTRSPAAFFTAKEKKGRDSFAPADLQFNPKK